jgi:hypothetical protein
VTFNLYEHRRADRFRDGNIDIVEVEAPEIFQVDRNFEKEFRVGFVICAANSSRVTIFAWGDEDKLRPAPKRIKRLTRSTYASFSWAPAVVCCVR